MNNQEIQEQAEQAYLEKFLERLQYDYSDIIRGEDPPDFYFKIQEKRIAVEITDYHSGRSNDNNHRWRMVEEERDKIRDLLNRKVSLHENLKGIHVHIIPRGLSLPSRKEYDPFTDEIISFIESKIGILQSQRVRDKKFLPEFSLLNQYVSRIYANKVNAKMFWDISQTASVGVSEEEFINTIEPKLGKPRPSDINENWLLIVSGARMSQSIGLHHHDHYNDFSQVNTMLENGPFEQIYIYDYMFSRILGWNLEEGWEELKGVIFADGEEVWDE